MSTWLISTNGLLLTAGNGLPSVGATPPPVATASAEITVSKRLVTATAPDMVVFEITNFSGFDTSGPAVGEVYNPRYHDLYYFWDFGDTTYSSFSAPTRVRSQHNNPNRMYGPFGRHVYRNAGSYSPKCTIYEPSSGKWAIAYLNSASTDSGTAGTATAALDVADSDTTFSGTNTVFVSPSGSFSNAPLGSVQITASDIDDVLNNLTTPQAGIAGASTPKRLMLNRGESYTFGGYNFSTGGGTPTLHVVAGGDAGAKPVVTQTGQWNDNNPPQGTTDFVVDGIEWNGPWDDTTLSGSKIQFYGMNFLRTGYPATVLLHDCAFSGYDCVSLAITGALARHWALVDCSITSWGEAGFYDYGVDYGTMLGCAIKSSPLSLTDTGTMGSSYRDSGAEYLVVYASDFFCKNGSDAFGSYNGEVAEQPALRVNAEQKPDMKSYVGCNVFEAGFQMLQYTKSGTNPDNDPAQNHVCEKNFFLCTAQTSDVIATSQTALTIRNNLFVLPQVNYAGTVWNSLSIWIKAVYRNEGEPETQDAPLDVYSNTFVILKPGATPPTSGAVDNRTDNGASFNNVTTVNNIFHYPDTATLTADLGLADTINDFLPLRIGYLDADTPLNRSELTPHSAIDFDAQTAAFTAGALLTASGGATAYIGEIVDNGGTGTLYLGEISGGPITDGETLTDSSGGSATANGGSRDSGCTDDFIPLTGSSVIGAYTTGKVAYDDFYGNIRDTVLSGLTRSTYSTGAHEPSLES